MQTKSKMMILFLATLYTTLVLHAQVAYGECPVGERTAHKCISGRLYKRLCPQNQYMATGKSCLADDYALNDEPDGIADPFECPSANGWFAHPTDANRFYLCKNYSPKPHSCHNDQFFNGIEGTCVQRGALFICPGQSYRLYVDPHDQSRYYICNNGVATHRPCDSDHVFDEGQQVCVNRYAVVRPVIVHPVSCPAYGIRLMRDPTNGAQYYLCTDGTYELVTCERDHVFDEEAQGCRSRYTHGHRWPPHPWRTVRGECKIEYIHNGHPAYTIVDVWDDEAYKWVRTEIPGQNNRGVYLRGRPSHLPGLPEPVIHSVRRRNNNY